MNQSQLEDKRILNEMLVVCSEFINKRISGKTFEKKYCFLWRKIRDENIEFESKIQDLLDEIWYDLDVFASDKKLLKQLLEDPPNEEEIINEEELRIRVGKSFQKIETIIKSVKNEKSKK